MDGIEAQEAARVAVRVVEAQEREVLVLVVLVQRALRRGVREVRARGAVDVPVEHGRVAEAERAGREAVVRALHGEHGALHDRGGRLVDVPERGDLGEEVLEVAPDAGVLVRRGEGDVVVVVQVRVLVGQRLDDRAADAGVAHRNVCVGRWAVSPDSMGEMVLTGIDEDDAVGGVGCVCDDPRAAALPQVKASVCLGQRGIALQRDSAPNR